MDCFSPLLRQLIVATTPQLAALSVGSLTGYPVVLLNQLRSNKTSISLDIDSASWVASIHGFAGVLSVLVPTIMHWKGRKFAFILSSCIIIAGWVLIYFAKNVNSILTGESLQGIGGNSLIVVSLVTISEMVEPRFRSTSLILFGVMQAMGFVMVTFLGDFLDWRYICTVMSVPVVISLILVCTWPESPSWLACKGKFSECEEAFIKLRGTGKDSMKELNELVKAQKKALTDVALTHKGNILRDFFVRVRRRDFYIPNFHAIVILFTFYWSGPLAITTYAIDVINTTSKGSDFSLFIYIDATIVTGCIFSVILVQYFKNKSIILTSHFICTIFLLLSVIVIYFKDFDIFPRQLLLLCILAYMLISVAGAGHLSFAVSTEVIPVKHRGVGGTLYILYNCLFNSVSIKVTPYLFQSIEVSGTLLVFSLITLVGSLYIWKFVPETKGRTLQEIEDFYNSGGFIVEDRDGKILDDDEV